MDMKNLDLKREFLNICDSKLLRTFDSLAESFLRATSSQEIRGFISSKGYEGCSVLAASVFHHFCSGDVNSFLLPYGRKVGDKKELHFFIFYRHSNKIVIHFRNYYGEFVNVSVYYNGEFFVHTLE